MKNNILDIFNIASTLADFVELGLADDQARSTQAKATATALKKLIVNFDANALEAPKKTFNIGKAMDQLAVVTSNTQKVEWQHPTFHDGGTFNMSLTVQDVQNGYTNNRKWVKTTCVEGNSATEKSVTRLVVWGQFKSQKPSLVGECAEVGETVQCDFKVKSSVKAGGKYNRNHHEVTIKVAKEFLTNR